MKNLCKLFKPIHLAKYVSIISILAYSAAATSSYQETIEQKFWGTLYKNGGETYYCNKPFTSKTPLLSVSHIYSGSGIREHLQCGTNRQCLRDSAQYQTIMSDLQNIVPANAYFEFKRKNSTFGVLDESVEANECDIRKRHHIIEPPSKLKGDIARAIFYMRDTYKLPMLGSTNDLERWSTADPPSDEELLRNNDIEIIQGTRNPYVVEVAPKTIDKPTPQNTDPKI